LPLCRAPLAESASLSPFSAATASVTTADSRTRSVLRSILRI
jgi:hypothetical protein